MAVLIMAMFQYQILKVIKNSHCKAILCGESEPSIFGMSQTSRPLGRSSPKSGWESIRAMWSQQIPIALFFLISPHRLWIGSLNILKIQIVEPTLMAYLNNNGGFWRGRLTNEMDLNGGSSSNPCLIHIHNSPFVVDFPMKTCFFSAKSPCLTPPEGQQRPTGAWRRQESVTLRAVLCHPLHQISLETWCF